MTTIIPTDYAAWLAELKTTIRSARLRASLAVNRELIALYWRIGKEILERQSVQGWGAKVIDQLAAIFVPSSQTCADFPLAT
jgi:predicted nuclease of restriction endonuclease-like (RecB) superfamily